MAKRKAAAKSGGIIKKTGNQVFSFGNQNTSGLYKTATSNVQTAQSFFYSPELTTESWLLPKSRQEILKWARIFFNLEPYIYKVIMMHSLYPFSKFEITTDDDSITAFYEDMAFNEDFDLYEFILDASLSYQKFGEAIPFGTMEKGNDNYYRWKKFILLEPDLVEVKSDMLEGNAQFELIPNKDLVELIKSTKEEDQARIQRLKENAPAAFEAVMNNKFIPLGEDNVSIIYNKTDPSATRGTSPIQCLFKVLIYQDWIRLAQSAFAQRYVFPVELWKIGDMANGVHPSDQDLEEFRAMIKQALAQPPFTIVYPDVVKYEALSVSGKNFPVNNEYEYIHDQLLVGLGVNKNIILGEGPSFSNVKTMALHKLMMEYKAVRDKFENWIINKFFRPIAKKNNFYATKDGKKKLILPTISWHKSLDIEGEKDEQDRMIEFWDKGIVSTKTLMSKFPNIDFDEEMKNLEEERGTIFDKGDERIAKKISKPRGGEGGGGGGAGLPGGGAMSVGDLPPEPMEPGAPEEEGAPGEGLPGEPIPESVETTETTQETTTSEPPTGV
jgi:hypothetical protein